MAKTPRTASGPAEGYSSLYRAGGPPGPIGPVAGVEGPWERLRALWEADEFWHSAPSHLDPRGLLGIAAGGLVAIGLGMLRLRFWWWPLHPVGFLAAQSWGMHWYYGPFFIGWIAKTLVTRYGGLRVYRQTVPLAVGLVVGDLLGKVLWALCDLVGKTGGAS